MKTLIRKTIGSFKIKKRNPMECPYDKKGRSCKHYNGTGGDMNVDCWRCDWYNYGVRPSKGFGM